MNMDQMRSSTQAPQRWKVRWMALSCLSARGRRFQWSRVIRAVLAGSEVHSSPATGGSVLPMASRRARTGDVSHPWSRGSAVGYTWFHRPVYESLTPRNVNVVYAGLNSAELVTKHVSMGDRVYRLGDCS